MSKNEEFESELFQNLDMEDKEHLNQPSKYDMALGKYNTALKDEEIRGGKRHARSKEVPLPLHRPHYPEMHGQRDQRHEVYRKSQCLR